MSMGTLVCSLGDVFQNPQESRKDFFDVVGESNGRKLSRISARRYFQARQAPSFIRSVGKRTIEWFD